MTRRPMGEAAYERLRSAIVERRLGPGTGLAETELADALGISRTPVRQALVRLQLEGLVTRDESGRLAVSQISAEKVVDLFEIRTVLEARASELAAERISDHELEALETLLREDHEALRSGSIEDLAAINRRIHDVIMQAARNRVLVELVRTLSHRLVGLMPFAVGNLEAQAQFVGQHARLVAFVRDGDGVRAAALVREHLKAAREILLTALWDEKDEAEASESLASLLAPRSMPDHPHGAAAGPVEQLSDAHASPL